MLHRDERFQIIVKLVAYCIYRLIHLIIQIESDFIALAKRLQHKTRQPVEYLNILWRYRLDSTDITHEHDLLVFNDGFGHFEELNDVRWHIYCITDRYVYLVRLPEDADISIEFNTKLQNLLFSAADRVARISLSEFVASAVKLPPVSCRTVFIHSIPSCGGTASGKLLQSSDPEHQSLVVVGEPPFLTSIAVLSHSVSIERIREITKGALRFSLQGYMKEKTVCMKTRSCCAEIVRYIHNASPSIQHVFITSRNPIESIQRLVQNTSEPYNAFKMICWFLHNCPSLCDFFTSWTKLEPETVVKVGPSFDFEFSLAQIMGATINYQRNLKYYALDTIYFEDLMSDTATSIKPLLSICEMSDLAIPECIAWKRDEEPTLRRIWNISPFTEEQMQRIKTLVDLLQQEWDH